MTRTPTVHRRRLAAELRRLRDAATLTIEEVASRARLSKSTLSRIETGQVSVAPRTVAVLLKLYNMPDAEAAGLIELARQAREHGWWYDYGDAMPKWFAGYVAFEDEATALRVYSIQLIHGLLQTADYARAVIQAGFPEEPSHRIDERVEFRLTRQKILDRPAPPRLWLVLDEAAICRPVGNHQIMADQLAHLAEASTRPTITIQILPFGQGAHAAMGVAFTIMDFGNPTDPPVVYQENLSGALFLDRPYHVETHGLAFDHLRADALSPAESTTLLHTRSQTMAGR
ncbi:MAG: helix-turn-helix domain-containing protein [Micromonosporaceae bacterium]|nr:helix-turn-helix domain-containing protein [Micromonosporaceae bacterium]